MEDKCIQLYNILYFVVLRIKLRCIKKIVWSAGTSIKHIWHDKRLNSLGVFHLAIATSYITVYILFYKMSFF